jgi:hypothetical protein
MWVIAAERDGSRRWLSDADRERAEREREHAEKVRERAKRLEVEQELAELRARLERR